MSIREEDVKSGRVVYSCHCGWIDTGHANPKSTRPFVSARSLWEQISKESGLTSKMPGARGFKVIYKQDMGNRVYKEGVARAYFVKYNLSLPQKESVALSIFMDVSEAFEAFQNDFWGGMVSHSSFSQDDLISNLIGFYRVVRPNVDYGKVCQFLDQAKSLAVFQGMSEQQREAKSKSWRSPLSYTCKDCPKAEFPKDLSVINPAPKGGKDTLFRAWTRDDDFGVIPKAKPKQIPMRARQKNDVLQGEGLKVSPRKAPGKNFDKR